MRQLLTKPQTMQQVAVEPVVQQVLLALLVLAVLRALQVHLALLVRPALRELAAPLVQVEVAVAVVQAAVVGKPSKSYSFVAFSKKYANNRRIFLSIAVCMLLVF